MKTLTTKLVRVMASMKRVAKNGRNVFHNYNYVTESDVLEAVRESLSKENIFIFTSVINSQYDSPSHMTSVAVKHTLVDGDTGESFEVMSLGQGQDKGDKGANKAITAAVKYMLLKNLMISTGDDSEATDADGKDTATNKPVKIVAVNSGSGGSTDSTIVDPATIASGKKFGFSNKVKLAKPDVETPNEL